MVSQSVDGYITIKGATEIINKLKNTIAKAKARIYVSATGAAIEALRTELVEAVARGLKVVIITGGPLLSKVQLFITPTSPIVRSA